MHISRWELLWSLGRTRVDSALGFEQCDLSEPDYGSDDDLTPSEDS